jgi:hypothetical protein
MNQATNYWSSVPHHANFFLGLGGHAPSLDTPLPPPDLNIHQQWYLFYKNCEFCHPTCSEPVHCCNSWPITRSDCGQWQIQVYPNMAHHENDKKQWLSCCVRNRQNAWLVSVNMLVPIFNLVQNFRKGNSETITALKVKCAFWGGLQLFQISCVSTHLHVKSNVFEIMCQIWRCITRM